MFFEVIHLQRTEILNFSSKSNKTIRCYDLMSYITYSQYGIETLTLLTVKAPTNPIFGFGGSSTQNEKGNIGRLCSMTICVHFPTDAFRSWKTLLIKHIIWLSNSLNLYMTALID